MTRLHDLTACIINTSNSFPTLPTSTVQLKFKCKNSQIVDKPKLRTHKTQTMHDKFQYEVSISVNQHFHIDKFLSWNFWFSFDLNIQNPAKKQTMMEDESILDKS